jgi:putative transcriptional regulator
MIDFNFENKDELKPGSILISEPFLDDNFFSRSVVYLCNHDEEGSFGFILNKYVENDLSEFIDDFPFSETRISVGGPVDTSNLFYIHSFGDAVSESVPMAEGLHIGGDFNNVKELLSADPENAKKIRFFVGYSGWSKDQLNSELNEKSWIVLNSISTDHILDTSNENVWRDSMKKLGGKFKIMSQFPKNPSDN